MPSVRWRMAHLPPPAGGEPPGNGGAGAASGSGRSRLSHVQERLGHSGQALLQVVGFAGQGRPSGSTPTAGQTEEQYAVRSVEDGRDLTKKSHQHL